MIGPVVEEVAQEHPEIKVCKVNVDEQPELAMQFKVMSIPMLVVMKQGEIVKKTIGAISKAEMLELLQ